MDHHKLFKTRTHDLLFEGHFLSFKDCLEQAVKQKINLSSIDLSNQNLSNAALDDAIMPHANFTNTNLTGANLSESYLRGAHFKNTSLYNACFCFSNLTECNFENSAFGATDIFGSIIAKSKFSALSCFSLNFSGTKNMQDCLFISPDGTTLSMSSPPIVIHGLDPQPVIIMDQDTRRGHNILNEERLAPLVQKISDKTLRRRLRYTAQDKNKV